jgi:signal transduction histidine kinase/ActR/RegA family two-component response regulator
VNADRPPRSDGSRGSHRSSVFLDAVRSVRGVLNRYTLLSIMGVWIAAAGTSWTLAERHAERVEREAESAALTRAGVAAEAIEQALARTLEATEALHALLQARLTLSRDGDTAGVAAIENQLQAVARREKFGVLQVASIGANGELSWSSVSDWSPVDLSDREHFRVHRDGKRGLFVSIPLVGRASGQWSVQLTRPLWDPSGTFAGVAVVSVDPLRLSRQLAALRFSDDSSITVLRMDGTIIAHGGKQVEQLGRQLAPDTQLMAAMANFPNGSLRLTDGTLVEPPRFVGYSVLRDAPLVVTVSLSVEHEVAAVAFVRPALRIAAIAYSVVLVALFGVGLMWLERRRALVSLQSAQREREEAIEQLIRAQQMEALGRLAGGMAHDFNNVLQTVLSGATIIERRAGEPDAVRHWARVLTEAADRGAGVTRRLLEHTRQRNLHPESVEVLPLLDALREVLAHTLGRQVRVLVDAQPDLPPVRADRRQLETVLVNLAINARDAASARPDCTITLRATAEAPYVGDAPGGTPSEDRPRWVRLTVQDDGPGMPAEVLSRATEHFFTTKATGTGLGLALAKSFADRSGGELAISSTPGLGTVVSVSLPAVSQSQPGIRRATRVVTSSRPMDLLVVDDEAEVRASLALVLRDRGYPVSETGSGGEALAWLDQGHALDALVTDLAMPEMDGLTLIQEARRRRPGLPALLVTGHAGTASKAAMEAARLGGPFRILQKPVAPGALTDALATLLSSADRPADAAQPGRQSARPGQVA